MTLDPMVLAELMVSADSALEIVRKMAGSEEADRTGVSLRVLDVLTGQAEVQFMVGKVEMTKDANRYWRLGPEKGNRLLSHPMHVTSRESADPTKEMYPGAVRCGTKIIDVSGLASGEDDETVAAIVGLKMGWQTLDACGIIAQVAGGNKMLQSYLGQLY